MPGRILIVEDVATNRLILKSRLMRAYYEVLEAVNGEEAIELALETNPDIILLDVMMPGIDGFETCRRLKSAPETLHIPIVMLTALDQQQDRVCGLEAGADDFLSKPFEDTALMSRVQSLTRMKMLVDELALRGQSGSGIGDQSMLDLARQTQFNDSRILLVTSNDVLGRALRESLGQEMGCKVEIATDIDDAHALLEFMTFDAIMIGKTGKDSDPLRFGSMVRARPETRQSATLLMLEKNDLAMATKALELGFSDYIACPVDLVEFTARMRSVLRRKHFADRLREKMRNSMVQAVTDPLTGAYNRRYANSHLETHIDRCRENDSMLAVMMLDIDFFKRVNDQYGHAAGDEVLREFARRLQVNVREMDLVSRMGGEEFMVIMPEVNARLVAEIAERVRAATESPGFDLPDMDEPISVTVSIGYAVLTAAEGADSLINRADRALYASKNDGRNRVTLDRAA